MGAYTTRLAWENLRSVDSAALDNTYQTLGTPLAHPSYILKLVNNSTVLVTISIDGVNDVDVAPAGSFWLYDESKNIQGVGPLIALPQGTQVYVKGAVAGVGLIYLVTQYLLTN